MDRELLSERVCDDGSSRKIELSIDRRLERGHFEGFVDTAGWDSV